MIATQETLNEFQPFSVVADHADITQDGKLVPVTGYRLYRDGVQLGEVPFSARVNGVVTFSVPTGWPTGVYQVQMSAYNAAGESVRATLPGGLIVGTPTPPPPGGGSTPYGGTPRAIPGTVEIEDFDLGGEGVAYHDMTAQNEFGIYRPNEGVDIGPTSDNGGGFNTESSEATEWLLYSVNVATTGLYTVEARVASAIAGGTFRLEGEHGPTLATFSIPNTGGWQTWQTVAIKGVPLTAGVQKIRLYHITNAEGVWWSGNLNWIKFTAESGPAVVDCVVSDWTMQSATNWSSCVNSTQTRTETWTRTITTQPANGGAACPALTETRTGSQSCTSPPPADTFTAVVGITKCRVTVTDVPPTTQTGWGVQFRFNNADGTFTNIGNRDASAPYTRTSSEKAPGTYQVSAFWTRTGSTAVTHGPVTVVCE